MGLINPLIPESQRGQCGASGPEPLEGGVILSHRGLFGKDSFLPALVPYSIKRERMERGRMRVERQEESERRGKRQEEGELGRETR